LAQWDTRHGDSRSFFAGKYFRQHVFSQSMSIRMMIYAATWSAAAGACLAAETTVLRFSFGTEPVAGFRKITTGTVYTTSSGFGFEAGANLEAHSNFVTAAKPFFFSVRLPEGNYGVKISLGDKQAESITTVKAEARRLMLENVRAPSGTHATREITVNIRTPRITGSARTVQLKDREKETEMVTWDERLTLEFNGTRPALRTIEIAPASVPTIFLAGDSTVCDQPREPWNSWGQMLPRFFEPGVAVANYAQSGESIKSSLGARRFEKIFNVMKPGDWLLIQFGHNDMKDRAPDALSIYKANLKRLVSETRSKGGTPVLITSMERKAGLNAPTLSGYPDTVRAAAREENAALIDLNAMSVQLYRALGTNLDRAFQDGTHHNNYGSYELAKCVAAGIVAAKLDLAKLMVHDVKNFDPARPDALETFRVPPSPANSGASPDGN